MHFNPASILTIRSQHTLRECLLTRLRGSRESWRPPASLRLTRNAFWAPVSKKAVVSKIVHSGRVRHRWQPGAAVKLTDDLPDQVGGNVGQSGGHFD